MSTTDTLDERIRHLVVELMESAPQAPTVSELEWRGDLGTTRTGAGRLMGVRRRPLFVISGIGTAVAVVLLLVLLLPSVGQHQPVAAAAQLNQIAVNAENQPTPSLGSGQYLETQSDVSLLATVTQVGSTPTPNAQATITGKITQWTDRYGDSCISATSSPAQFASPTNREAWSAAGVLDSPTGQPATSCESSSASLIPSDSPSTTGGIIDVSALPTDPAVLADELSSGATGITSLDQISLPAGENAGFVRAANLLVGPTVGGSPAFTSALFKALALIPDVSALGSTTTHSGASGLGFSGASETGRSVIVVDPATGVLLEARNLESPFIFEGLGQSYLAPAPTPSIGTEGGSYGTVIQWLDPIGTPRVVDSLPSGLSVAQPVPAAAAIKAIADQNVTYTQIEYLGTLLQQRFGNFVTSSFAVANGGDVVEYELGSVSAMRHYADSMRASGLFSSITEYTAKGEGLTLPTEQTPPDSAARSVVAKASTIPAAVYDEVGANPSSAASAITKPIVLHGQPPLDLAGSKPTVLYIGANYCPYCAADRWALVAALSRFGTWSHLKLTTSSATDVDPKTNTFSFEDATYSSPYLSLVAVEGGTASPPLTGAEQQVVSTYQTPAFIPGATAGDYGIPFIDIDNGALISGASFNPGVLSGLSWSQIADGLSDPSNPATQSIVAAANDITAAVCASTHGLPASVCSSPGVEAAATSLGLSG